MSLSAEVMERLQDEFTADPKNLLAQNVCTRADPLEAALSRRALERINHVFQHRVEEVKPCTDQVASGICWMYAGMNAMRIPFMKAFNIKSFEFSQSYLFFWDKVERTNFFLRAIVDTARRGEPVDGRLVSFLLQRPLDDGGQWDMLLNLINKYGVMPKSCFPSARSTERSSSMNGVLMSKLREFARDLRHLVEKGTTDEDLEVTIADQVGQIHRILAICLGLPPRSFTWEYYDREKAYHKVGPLSPRDFYERHVKPHFNAEEQVCLTHDPRPANPSGALYTVDRLGNMVGGRATLYNSQPVELLARLAAAAIVDGKPVWFGCEVSQFFSMKLGINDCSLYDHKVLFGVDVTLPLTKAERLTFGDTMMDHAMCLTGVTLDEDGKPLKWRVENSWGEKDGDKGYMVMSHSWFEEFVFEVVVDKKFVPEDVMAVFDQEPIVLPAWDPLGALARVRSN
ncbi:bleomycin hydrolase-like [Pollicipes pollicipes]|uniref:bleomycin hydrolase-like n=1 Tax=Pollicipes pollicipes TaxID=41117 RepID=UPI001884F69E|nr:bleomycin hydrolase-like isoform X1 [Pollicipes pollicipes]XP_037072740.1 bleomycin hydrolase-like isoform X2 [Pollicipes pollicipes]XP_037072811.1 bleomycin hydrolase-like [Pollicipes pollicipes]